MKDKELNQVIAAVLPEVRELRHDLHRHPELGYAEHRTAKQVVDFLKGIEGIDIQEGIAGTGLVVTIGKEIEGPCVALRADMDALPIEEQSGVEWSSETPGKMHACGHDGHTAMLAGAARILAGMREELKGPVKCIFQPAEEGGGGGKKLCDAGVLKDPEVAAIFGLHNNLPDPEMQIGQIAYVKGAAMAGTGIFTIEVRGVGGHAAFPHKCIDPVYIGASIVQQLQGIVSRQIDPLSPAVLSVTCFEAGSAFNIIPEKAILKGTIRALDKQILLQLRDAVIHRCEQVAQAHGATAHVKCDLSYPVLVNNEVAEGCFLSVMEAIGDLDKVVVTDPIMGGEDFAFYGQLVPAFFYFLPACPVGQPTNPICHSPAFDFNDDLLPTGIRLHVEIARRFAGLWKC